MPRIKDKAGQTFGRLTVLRATDERYLRAVIWECKCTCGNLTYVPTNVLKSGNTKSCGCLLVDLHTTHGKSKTRIHNIWRAMLNRCYLKSNIGYTRYSSKGITVCEDWHTFEGFYADMGDPPTEKHTLDRINNAGNYERGNCRWATMREQQNNKSTNRRISYLGREQTISEWSSELGLYSRLIIERLNMGWSVSTALTAPIVKGRRKRASI